MSHACKTVFVFKTYVTESPVYWRIKTFIPLERNCLAESYRGINFKREEKRNPDPGPAETRFGIIFPKNSSILA